MAGRATVLPGRYPGRMLLFALACAPQESPSTRRSDTDTDTDADTDTDTDADTDTDTDTDGCPPEMALAGAVCIDRWEASLVDQSPYDVPSAGVATAAEGAVPQGYISGDAAAAACEAAGKRLCTVEEWGRACGGPDDTVYPYGDTYDATACNDTYAGGHPVVDYFGTSDGIWDTEHMNDPGINQQPGTLDASGANPGCVTPEGVYDLHGNLHEWVADPEGTFKGGFYADAAINGAGCSYTTTAHDTSYHDYSTGFRCCVEPG
jgi:sulfatase modifying factor 1